MDRSTICGRGRPRPDARSGFTPRATSSAVRRRPRPRRYYEHYAVEMEDTAGADHYMGNKAKFSGSHDPEAYRLHRKRFVGGAGTYPLIGTPRRIAEELGGDQSRRVCRRGAVVCELQGRAAVFHRHSAAVAARGGAAQRVIGQSSDADGWPLTVGTRRNGSLRRAASLRGGVIPSAAKCHRAHSEAISRE